MEIPSEIYVALSGSQGERVRRLNVFKKSYTLLNWILVSGTYAGDSVNYLLVGFELKENGACDQAIPGWVLPKGSSNQSLDYSKRICTRDTCKEYDSCDLRGLLKEALGEE